MPGSPTPSRRILFLSLFLGFAALYASTISKQYSYDGLCYALDVERAPFGNLFHPNHLLYSFAQKQIWLFSKVSGYSIKAIFVMQCVNVLVAAFAVAALGALLVARAGLAPAFLAAFFFGVSQAFWMEAVDPGCYAWAALAAILFYATFDHAEREPPWVWGMVQGFLILWHQMLILLVPVMLWRLERGKRLTYLAALVPMVCGPYAWAAFTFHGPALHDALFWALGPAGPPPNVAIMSRFWWSTDLWINSQAWISALEQTVVRLPLVSAYAPWILHSAVVLILTFSFIRLWKIERKIPEERVWMQTLLLACAVLSLFQFFFYVGALRYRILMLPFLLALGARGLKNVSHKANAAVFLLMAGIAVINATGDIQKRRSIDTDGIRTQWIREQLTPRDFFIFGGVSGSSITNVYLAYFAPKIPAQSLKGYFFAHPDHHLNDLLDRMLFLQHSGMRIWTEPAYASLFPGWKAGPVAPGPDGYGLVLMAPEVQAK
jgi:hypothetical protein